MIWIILTIIALLIIASTMIYFLVRSLGFERRENDYLKGEMEIEQQRKEIAARSPSDADSLLGRMRSEDNK